LKTLLEHVSCARLPAQALLGLAGLRRVEGISVIAEGDHAWVFWEAGDERVLRAVLPASGVELFEKRGDDWYRAGHRLPSFGVPPRGEPLALARAITPEPFSAELPGGGATRPSRLSLARDVRPRPTTAALCPLVELARWADLATSADLEAIRGAVARESALLLGQSLPPWSGAERFWGRQVLVPIGFKPWPALPEAALREALGASEEEVLRLVPGPDGLMVEAIPIEAFGRLSRAGVRLALAGVRPS
jgi:MoxR-vWA-beta-propeller ternary system domain bpX2